MSATGLVSVFAVINTALFIHICACHLTPFGLPCLFRPSSLQLPSFQTPIPFVPRRQTHPQPLSWPFWSLRASVEAGLQTVPVATRKQSHGLLRETGREPLNFILLTDDSFVLAALLVALSPQPQSISATLSAPVFVLRIQPKLSASSSKCRAGTRPD